jgi:hypothetical protein
MAASPAAEICTAKSDPKTLGKAYNADSNKKNAIKVFFSAEN